MSYFLPALKDTELFRQFQFTIFNVGSRRLSAQDDHSGQGWQLFAPNLRIYGFDADQDACDAVNQELAEKQINWFEQHFPLAIGKATEERKLYVTANPMCSSLYPPNEAYQARFRGMLDYSKLDFYVDIETTTLDTFCAEASIREVDFLKIDVQGADLDVLQGAETILDHVLAIQVEVCFSPLYVDQPLFADVDTYLRRQGFTFCNLSVAHRQYAQSPIISKKHPGRLLWGDAFYLRDLLDPTTNATANLEHIFKLACVADVLEFYDYALELLIYLTLQSIDKPQFNFAALILDRLEQTAGLNDIQNSDLYQTLTAYLKPI